MNPLPSTAELLTSGDDHRLKPDPITGRNHYLCHPTPDDNTLRFGSSTASNIDQQGWQIANQIREQMAQDSTTMERPLWLQQHYDHICHTLRTLWSLPDSTAITLTESGTSAHRLAAEIVSTESSYPLRTIIMQPSETGSGVPAAATLNNSLPLHTIALRNSDGTPRSAAAIDTAVVQQVERSIQQGGALLLIMVDGSKSGLQAPSLTTALALRQQFPDRIHLLLDGCQLRFGSASVRHYLEQGVMVAITGSKFFAGPSFSGALLTPAGREQPVRAHAGLLLRWQVALQTMAL
ncbi:MAG: hypothetical protein Q9M13_04035, partial [Mariprofundales bacterium]|nr:hypothetical protein [Mariprofundales bacterium]